MLVKTPKSGNDKLAQFSDVDDPSRVSEPPKKWRRNMRDRKEKRWPR